MQNFDLFYEYRECDYTMPGAILWDSDALKTSRTAAREPSALFTHQLQQHSPPADIGTHVQDIAPLQVDRSANQSQGRTGSASGMDELHLEHQDHSRTTAQLEDDSNSASQIESWLSSSVSSDSPEETSGSPFNTVPILIDSTVLQSAESEEGIGLGLVGGFSRSSTPALSFSSSRSSSPQPSTYKSPELGGPLLFNHVSSPEPLPHLELIDSHSDLTEPGREWPIVGDERILQSLSACDFPATLDSHSTSRSSTPLLLPPNLRSDFTEPGGERLIPVSDERILQSLSACDFPAVLDSHSTSPLSTPLLLPPSCSVSPSSSNSSLTDLNGDHSHGISFSSFLSPSPSRYVHRSPRIKRVRREVQQQNSPDDEYAELDDDFEDDDLDSYDPMHDQFTSRRKRKTPYSSESLEDRTCRVCGSVFSRAADNERHYFSTHSGLMKEESTCVLCLKVLARPDARKRHLGTLTKKCMREAKRRLECGELDSEIYHLYLS